MTRNQRFSLNETRYVIDRINPANSGKGYCHKGDPEDDRHLRKLVLMARLAGLVNDLIIERNSHDDRLFNEGDSIWVALLKTIDASHLETLHVALSIQHKFAGELKREKLGWQALTSLSLFVDDVERLLRDLYGEFDNEAIDRVRWAVFVVAEEFTKYLREDIWREHQDAQHIDYSCGIGVPEGYGISGSDHWQALKSANDLAVRARAVLANPTAFSKYTVEFVKELKDVYERWLVEEAEGELIEDKIPFRENRAAKRPNASFATK